MIINSTLYNIELWRSVPIMKFRDLILTNQDAEVISEAELSSIAASSVQADVYAEQLAVQLRKGFLVYCVLKVCACDSKYTSDIISELKSAELVVVEGTIYPLLSRLQKDDLLIYEWKESDQGPPRKYYRITQYGRDVLEIVEKKVMHLNKILKKL